ncbi:hypothetical protein LshimejAT787_0100010 [Lyophyllum shimeji]|uniref:Uncharacterized protein n=1 Tax=Lyophyllum shimeji TaxID=47721 RepID=A0A9P3UJB0_LYOSH|nr:hypothetical protein LshimejAT787_0100010 [Lyophyllum shimeji]
MLVMASENYPLVNLSVGRFCSAAKRLLSQDAHADFANFVLTGTSNKKQAVIDPILDSLSEDEPFSELRDYDSLLGIDSGISVTTSLTLYPIAKHEDTLTADIHVSYHFTNTKGSFTSPVHAIPNLCLGKWGTHNIIRVMIPELYHDQRSSPRLSQDEQRIFYEQGLRPAMEELLGDKAAEWPATYDDEMFRARGKDGRLALTTKMFPEWLVDQLGDQIRASLQDHGCSWGTGLVFLHQVRGVKHSSSHSVDAECAQRALQDFIEENNLDLTSLQSSGEWWIDVGLEIASGEGNCLAWRTDSHYHVVKRALDITSDVAHRITSVGSSKYTRDMSSHLPAVSGCRISPGPRARGPFEVQYMQAYTTEKALIYRPDRGHFGKFITCADVLNGKAMKFIDDLYELYRNAIDTNCSLARIEVRVPLRHGAAVLLDLDEELLRESLVSFSRSVWWSLRSYRALAIKFILEWQLDGDASHRAKDAALLLTAAATWLLNGLHSTPDKGASSKELMAAILPHVSRAGADPDILAYGSPTDDDDVDSQTDSEAEDEPPTTRRRRDAVTLPSYPFGLVFLRRIRVGEQYPVPRFSNDGQFISPRAFRFFFGVDHEDVDAEYFRKALTQKAHPDRVRNRAKRTPAWHNRDQETTRKDFNLARLGYELTPPMRDRGSDVDEDEEHSGAEERDIDDEITAVWRQFLIDVTAKAPNKKNAHEPSHCRLSTEERLLVTEDTYQNRKLSVYFHDCQWKLADRKDWQNVFDRLFPPKGHIFTGNVQNYLSTSYIPMWEKIKSRADDDTYLRIRQDIRKRFDRLYWMPLAQTDRIWYTKFDAKFTKSSGLNRRAPSPLILINSSTPPTW